FFATLWDKSGINYSGNGLGHDLTLIVDQNPNTTYILNESYQPEFGDYTRGSVLFNIPELSNGSHTLTLRAWDVLNNVSQQSLDFVVDHSLKPAILSVQASQNPAAESTNFLIRHDRAGSAVDLTVEVFNFAGQRMWSHSETQTGSTGVLTVPWNLTNNVGGRLHAGVYLYRVTMSSGGSKDVSKTQKIIINGNK
ncbi:MAG: T9SS type A sorting domain-containing protein, partial [Bacteroidaceae bacterium]|nr:T9SS type A sorting domain-containing protein [Bacteroidaceae bacterium]